MNEVICIPITSNLLSFRKYNYYCKKMTVKNELLEKNVVNIEIINMPVLTIYFNYIRIHS